MIYTTYLAQMKKLPEDAIKVLICRHLPRGFKEDKDRNIFHNPSLAPSETLLEGYKRGLCDWNTFAKEYNWEMENYPPLKAAIAGLIYYLREKEDENIFLICYEKDFYSCHRHLLALYLKEKYDINCEEWSPDGGIHH
jgi:uncharacterized protein YeaO (DUF488 family)